MLIKQISAFCLYLTSFIMTAQPESLYDAHQISPQLLANANAVVRWDKTTTTIDDIDDVTIQIKRVVTIFNENGIRHMGTVVGYDNSRSIKNLEARIFDERGEEIKKFKKNDFEDESAVDNGTLYSDSRVKYLRYTPIKYPYTIEFDAELQFASTAYLPKWTPLEGYYVSTEKSIFEIINRSTIPLKLKDQNFEGFTIEKKDGNYFKAENLSAINPEAYSPGLNRLAPSLKVAMSKFNMDGVPGVNNEWSDFGQWYKDNLLEGTDILPDAVIADIQNRTAGIDDPLEKAKIVYKFVQEKTRYISVQVGIGGWKPFNAEDVDRLGYSDCKGLSNYTRALLAAVGVESNIVLLYGGRDIRNLETEFSIPEGNHAILNIPINNENIWLECTSQTAPFGHIAGFTDDRDVLVITSEGGKIVHTKEYKAEENLQETSADITIMPDATLKGNVEVKTYGYQYSEHRNKQFLPLKDQELSLKEYWDNINNLKLEKFELKDDRDNVKFTESATISAEAYATKTGNLLLFQPNAFNIVETIPTRYSVRTQDFEVDRGFLDTDEFTINIPQGLEVEALPSDANIESKFGRYQSTITRISENQLQYKRMFTLNKGYYDKAEYEDFRSFMASVVKNDKAKIALKLLD